MAYLITAAVAYLFGCFSPAILLSRLLYGRDVRKLGSGNAGATNMARSFGVAIGVLTFAGDFLKAAAAMWIGNRLSGDWGVCLAGICCVTGHCYPAIHHFKGGKGAAVGAAIAFALSWKLGLICLATFLLVTLISKKVSAGSMLAAFSVCIVVAVTHKPLYQLVLAFFATLLMVFRHRENIKRIFNGTEPDFKAGKQK